MDEIKRYIDCTVPVTNCTLRCHYCYITQHRLFDGPIPDLPYSPAHVRRALSKERLGGTCLINFCGDGETTLVPKLVEYVRELLEEGHYVMIVTNGTVTKRMVEFSELPASLKKHLFFKFSYHFLELRRKGLTEVFFNNIKNVWKAGCSFTLELTPSDELVPFIEDVKEESLQYLGALPHVTIARDERNPRKLPILTQMSDEDYYKTWSSFDSKLLDYKISIFGHKRKEFCYAGDWSFCLNLRSGMMSQCYKSHFRQNIFKDINKPIKFLPIGNHCLAHHCYNGHSFLVLGDIPELEAPTYTEERNRHCIDGTEWLSQDMKHFMSTKLYDSNMEYNSSQKEKANRLFVFYMLRNKLQKVIVKIRTLIK